MDRERAISKLRLMKCNTAWHKDFDEALDLAIEALQESQTTHDQMDACYMAQKKAVDKLQPRNWEDLRRYRGEAEPKETQGERMTRIVHELSGCDAESATTTDCISRADTIKALCQECKVFLGDGVNCADCTEVAIVKGMPPVKLKNPCDSLLTAESDECKEQKSKLDCISRADIEYHTQLEARGNGQYEEVEVAYKSDIDNLPQVVPDFKTFCGVPIAEAIEVLEKYKHSPSVTPTERTGVWIRKGGSFQCPVCGEIWNFFNDTRKNFCPNCGAKMGGDTE